MVTYSYSPKKKTKKKEEKEFGDIVILTYRNTVFSIWKRKKKIAEDSYITHRDI